MEDSIKNIITALLADDDSALKELFRAQVEDAVNQFLQNEMTAVLGYEPYARAGQDGQRNYRNGYYNRSFDSMLGDLTVKTPRDRLGLFKNALFEPYARRTSTLEETIIMMYSKGITTREIAELIEKMYGQYYSPATVSNITKQTASLVEEFHNRKFKQSQYVCVFLDATYIPLRRDTVERETVNIAIGIRSDGTKEVLDYCIAPTENGVVWSELLSGLRQRGITDIQLFIADGMVGLQGAIERNYPQAKFQRCWVHLERNLYGYVRKADRGDVVGEFKEIRKAKNLPAARQKLNDFIEHWKKRYKRVEQLAELSGLFTFYDFPEAIRSTIYTTNVIESFNKQLKRQIDKKEQFPNEDALDRFVMTQVATYNDQNVSRIRRTRTGFTSCKDTLDAMF